MTRFLSLRWLLRVVLVVVLVVLAVPLVTATRIWIVSRQDDRSRADVLLVLGAAQYNGRPSAVLAARLQHAVTLFDEKVAPTIMTLGGKRPGDRYTEAGTGRAYLIQEGVPAADVVAVPYGDDTLRSMEAAAEAMKARGMRSAVIVTDPDHSLRSRTMARDLGMKAWTSPERYDASRDSSPQGLRYLARETAAYLDYVLLKRSGVHAVLG